MRGLGVGEAAEALCEIRARSEERGEVGVFEGVAGLLSGEWVHADEALYEGDWASTLPEPDRIAVLAEAGAACEAANRPLPGSGDYNLACIQARRGELDAASSAWASHQACSHRCSTRSGRWQSLTRTVTGGRFAGDEYRLRPTGASERADAPPTPPAPSVRASRWGRRAHRRRLGAAASYQSERGRASWSGPYRIPPPETTYAFPCEVVE